MHGYKSFRRHLRGQPEAARLLRSLGKRKRLAIAYKERPP